MINAYDIETYVDNNTKFHIPYCICFILNNKNFSLYYEKNEDIVLKSLFVIFDNISTEETTYIYIHKLDFDGMLLLSSLSKQTDIKFSVLTRESNIYAIKLIRNKKKIEFKCSKKILPSSLKKIAKSFNLPPKLPFPYKFADVDVLNYIGKTPDESFFSSYDDWKNLTNLTVFNFKKYSILYCFRDVKITKCFLKVIDKIIKNNFNISIHETYSAPSLSLKIFEKKFNNNQLKLIYNPMLDNLVRPAYYGGRCEVYGNPYEDEKIFHFDFSGMYGLCMQEKFPHGKYKIIENDFNLEIPGFYCIEFYSNDLYIPVLPHHRLKNNKLMFTNGYGDNVYWFEEILLFLKLGGKIRKIKYGIVFNEYSSLFSEFVNFFTQMRTLGEEYKTFAKLIINSLYGRLGMDENLFYSLFIKQEDYEKYSNKYNIITRSPLNDLDFIKIELTPQVIKDLSIKLKKNKGNVAIAAAVTSKARVKLLNAQLAVIENGGRILYSDTDSIFAAYKTDVTNQRHGEVFWDGSKNNTFIDDAVFIAPKTYAVKYKNITEVKIKGLAQNSINYAELKELFYANSTHVVIENFHAITRKNFNLKNEISTKDILLNAYDKRKFINNKKNTIPFFYENYTYI